MGHERTNWFLFAKALSLALLPAACAGVDEPSPGPSDDASASDTRSSDSRPDLALKDAQTLADSDALVERDDAFGDIGLDSLGGGDAGTDAEARSDMGRPLDTSEGEVRDGESGHDASSDPYDDRPTAIDGPFIDRNWTFDAASGCANVVPLPPPSSTEARLWFTSSQIAGIMKARSRGDVLYGAANPPFRLDAAALSLCRLPAPSGPSPLAQDILAPEGTSLIAVAFGAEDTPREIRTSQNDGQTWSIARQPAAPPLTVSIPCSLTSLRASNGAAPRMFATYGGTTLDVSDNGGLDWYRAIEGGSTPAEGFTVDTSGENLWYVSEAAPDRVAAYRISVSPSGALASSWNFQRLESWDANGVYVAQPDPFDPGAIYLGGEGRLGRLTLAAGQVSVALPWSRAPNTGELYTYVTALWVDPQTKDHVIWGGGQQGGGPVEVLESTQGGAGAQPIPLEGKPGGTVRAIQYLSGLHKLALLVGQLNSSLAVYVIDR